MTVWEPGVTDEQHHVIAVSGALDMDTVDRLERDIHIRTAAGDVDIILDLAEVELCDAAAMSGLIRAAERCRAAGGSLRLAAPTGIVATAFQVVEFDKVLPIYPTVDAARTG